MDGTQFFRHEIGPRRGIVFLIIQRAPGKKLFRNYLAFKGEHTGTLKISSRRDCHCFPFWKGLLETFRVRCSGLHLTPGFLGVPGNANDKGLATSFGSQALIKRRFSHVQNVLKNW